MCGIIGAYGEQLGLVDSGLSLLKHRGPNGSDIHAMPRGVLGHTRLAIMDVEGGHQPMSNPDASRWLVHNGEIYNHRALRQQHRDYPFKTQSDSEVILALYERYGPDCVRMLDGMFAIAILDHDGLFLARDPLGIKPLYYGWRGDTLYFASEIKALQGVVDDVIEFPPGTWYSTRHGFVQYYDVRALAEQPPQADAPSLDSVRECLKEAVRKRLMSDVPLGVFLSGGLDSSIIAACVADALPHVHSFAVGMEGSEDLARARQMAKMLGTQHHEYVYTVSEMVDVLPEVIYYLESFDPALVRSAVANYFLARLASEYVTVVLSGEGADELYSGYSYLKAIPTPEALHQELVEITSELHNRNLQRLDRITMAHGLEGRVPFLDVAFIEQAFSVPISQKLYGEARIEKWALRKAFEPVLPAEIAWRKKEKFSKGAGSAHVFAQLANAEIAEAEFAAETRRILDETGCAVKSKEELYYYRIFRDHFKPSVTRLVGRSRSL